jgi:hypothetical protein
MNTARYGFRHAISGESLTPSHSDSNYAGFVLDEQSDRLAAEPPSCCQIRDRIMRLERRVLTD